MKETLMELVNLSPHADYAIQQVDERFLKAVELRELGFKNQADKIELEALRDDKLNQIAKAGYIKITVKNIKDYLQRKVDKYNKERKEKTKMQDFTDIARSFRTSGFMRLMHDSPYSLPRLYPYPRDFSELNDRIFVKNTCDYYKTDGIGRYQWNEVPLEKYSDTLPPANILNRLKEEKNKNIFDYFTIAKVNEIVDPLLLGRINGCDDAFFIAQWDKDVSLDDLIQ